MSVPELRGSKVKGQSTEYCVEVVVSGRLTQTWLRYSELRDLSQRLKGVKGKITLIEGLFRNAPIHRKHDKNAYIVFYPRFCLFRNGPLVT